MARERHLTVEEAILLHLLEYSRYSPGDDVPAALTQAGISAALGVRRSHVSMSLDAAAKKGRVQEASSRVRGGRRRRKSYFLTPEGRALAAELRQAVVQKPVTATLPDGTEVKGTLGEIVRIPGINLTLPAAALALRAGHLDISSSGQVLPTPRSEIPGVEFLVGREAEVRALEGFLAGGGIMLLRGMPGIGKTALAAFVLSGRPAGSVFWYDITGWSTPRNVATHLAGFLGERCPRLSRYMKVHEIPDLGDLQDILSPLGEDMVLVFDDCQNASPGIESFLRMLARICDGHGSMKLLLITRSGPDFGDWLHMPASEITLGPLDMDASMKILRRRGIDGEAARRLAEQSGGHPMFLILADADTGADDIKALLARAISRELSDTENTLLRRLSVFREPVGADAVMTSGDDIAALEELMARCLVQDAGGLTLHGLVRDYYHEAQSPNERAEAHRMAAEYYRRQPPSSRAEMELAYHLVMAGEHGDAARLFQDRGEAWLRDGYAEEMLQLAGLLPADPGPAYWFDYMAGSALEHLGDWEGAMDRYAACLSAAGDEGNTADRARALAGMGRILYRQGRLGEAREILEEAMGLMLPALEERLLARIHGTLGVVLWRLGHVIPAGEMYARDLRISRRTGDRRGIARALNNLGILDWQSGNAGAALEKYAEALEHAERLGDLRLVAMLYSNIGDAHRTLGEMAEARRYYLRCLDISEDLKFHWQVAEAYRGLAQIPGEDREALLKEALAIFRRLGATEDAKAVKEMMR